MSAAKTVGSNKSGKDIISTADADADASSSRTSSTSAYKAAYNRHRRRPNEPNFLGDLDDGDVIDFSSYHTSTKPDDRIIPLVNPNIISEKSSTETETGSKKYTSTSGSDCDRALHKYKGPIYGIKSHPGFMYIPQALSLQLQHDLAYRALTEYCNAPHATNIDLVPTKENESINDVDDVANNSSHSMWNLWKSQHIHVQSSSHVDEIIDSGSGSAKKKTRKDKSAPSEQVQMSSRKLKYYNNFDKLSWATTGYHYDWTARAYKEDRKSIMPPVMEALGVIFAQLDMDMDRPMIGTAKSGSSSSSIHQELPETETFRLDQLAEPEQEGKRQQQRHQFAASASIVNYYSLKSNMGGHRDDLELDFTQPVVSISLGLPAIFLLGGDTKDCEPVVPILVRPGDVYLLAGDSRLCYHGMARVITSDASTLLPALTLGKNELNSSFAKDTNSTRLSRENFEDFQIHQWTNLSEELSHEDGKRDAISSSEWEAIKTFLSLHRININVRQVLPHGIPSIPT
mmetsp:Transcript_22362/g.33036  ORF Transcript_22362/g.33036 Transcript_22362/m.33036 type:complete len:514 (-) Transcript_22362:600-2141(-)